MKKVVLGISGGVDSSVAAILLKKQGYEVIGLFMRNWDSGVNNDYLGNPNLNNNICPQEQDYNDALEVCERIGIPLHRIDFVKEYWDYVFTYFLDELKQGRTPNPDIMCNKYIKFDQFAKEAEKLGADYIATGHYAKVAILDNGRYAVCKSKTDKKDQTYALYNLTQQQLSKTLMPVGEYEKDEVRSIAEKAGLLTAHKPDSQEICFIPDNNYAKYIEQESGKIFPEGNFVDINGNVIGRHKGIIHYTIGQRKGLNLSMGRPVFVLAIRPETNEVVIGDNKDTFHSELAASKINLMSVSSIDAPLKVNAKIRYSHKGAPCTVEMTGEDEIRCIFDEPVRAITPGQAIVFYNGDIVVGGATIDRVLD